MSLCDGWLLREIGCICFPSRLFCLQRSRGTSRCVGPHHFFSSGATIDAEIHVWSWSLLPLFYERFHTSQDGDRQLRHRTIHPQNFQLLFTYLAEKKIMNLTPKNWVYKNHTSFLLFYQKVSLLSRKKGSHISDAGLFGAPFPVSADESWNWNNNGEGAKMQVMHFPPIEMRWCQRWNWGFIEAFYPGFASRSGVIQRHPMDANAWYGFVGSGAFSG